MHTALHTTDQLAAAHTDAATRRRHAAEARTARQLHPTTNHGRRIVGAIVALTLGAGLVAGPATAQQASDTYTGGDKQISGLVDGWFDPTDRPAEVADNGTYR